MLDYINVPSQHEGFGVTKINSGVFNNFAPLKRIIIPSTVKTIAGPIFLGCNNIESITIPFAGKSASGSDSFLGYLFGATSYLNNKESVPSSLHEIVLKELSLISDNAFYGCSSLTAIDIPESVTSIGSNAFYGCSSLTAIDIPESVTSIGSNAFYGCSSLTSLTIPNGISSLEVGLLKNCSSLTTLVLHEGIQIIDSESLYGCSSLTSIGIPNTVTRIKSNAFVGCSSLTSLLVPESVTQIDFGAFSGCSSLVSITLPFLGLNKTTSTQSSEEYVFGHVFGKSSFEGSVRVSQHIQHISTNYYNFYFPASLKSVSITGGAIHSGAFSNCNFIESISIPNDVKIIGDDAFYRCSSLTSLSLPNATTIGIGAFQGCSSLTSLSLPKVINIRSAAFCGCSSLKTIDLNPDIITSVEKDAFYKCSSLTSVVLPLDKYKLGYFFLDTIPSALENIVISKKSSSIVSNAFRGCKTIKTITMYDAITSIGENAFNDCVADVHFYGDLNSWQKIKNKNYLGSSINFHLHFDGDAETLSLDLPDGTTSLAENAFYSCTSLTEISLPNSVTSIGKNAFYRCDLDINYHGTLAEWLALSGKTNFGSSTRIHLFLNGDIETTTIILPDGTTSLEEGAFYNCSSLTSITFPDSVTSIGSNAFTGCSSLSTITIPEGTSTLNLTMLTNSGVTTLNLPESITSIAKYYSNCPSLTTINYYGTLEKWLNITNKDFLRGIKAKVHLYLDGSEEEATTAVIPEGYTSVEAYAFFNCASLRTIAVPNSVLTIRQSAFYGCSSLETIYIPFVGSGDYGYGMTRSKMLGFIFGPEEFEGATETSQFTGNYDYGSDHVTSITSDEKYYIPNSLKHVIVTNDTYKTITGFSNIESLESVVVPDTMTSISATAFYFCRSLREFKIPSSVTSIGGYAFYATGYFESLNIPEGVTQIEAETFSYSHVQSIKLPNTLKTIGDNAFFECFSLTAIDIPNSVISLGKSTFSGCKKAETLHISNSLETIVASTFSHNESLKEVEIPNGVKTIGGGAFSYCYSLTKVSISETTELISARAFGNCSQLETVVIHNSSCSIDSDAFWSCSSLKDVNFIGSIDSWLATDDHSFLKNYSYNLTMHFYLNGNENESEDIKIPNNVTSISSFAFYNSLIRTIIIPTSVTYIGSYAFSYQNDNSPYLKYVFYKGSKIEYSAIDISSNCGYDISIVYFYSEEEPVDSGNYWHYVDGVPTIW